MFDLPIDREGDVVVISEGGTCIGTTPSAHDLSALEGHALRSHGGIAESRVPFILNYPLNETYAERAARGGLRNFHIFDFAINGVATLDQQRFSDRAAWDPWHREARRRTD